jgi:hypothetical protein
MTDPEKPADEALIEELRAKAFRSMRYRRRRFNIPPEIQAHPCWRGAARLAALSAPGAAWKPISELPDSASDLVLAVTADGRMMIWSASILLRATLRPDTPSHLRFPATHWRELPAPPDAPGPEGEG